MTQPQQQQPQQPPSAHSLRRSGRAAAPAAHIATLERIERRLETALTDLRVLRTELQRDVTSRGVLGSRGLTQFIIEQLQTAAAEHARCLQASQHVAAGQQQPRMAVPAPGIAINDLLALAERAGYEPPTRRTLSKRLTERNYRVGDIAFDQTAQVWYWQGERAAAATDTATTTIEEADIERL